MVRGRQAGALKKDILNGKMRPVTADRLLTIKDNTIIAIGKRRNGRAAALVEGTAARNSAQNHIGSSLRVDIIISGRH